MQNGWKILLEIIGKNKNILLKPAPTIWFTKFGDNSIDLVVMYWIKHFDFDYDVKSDMIIAIDKALKQNKIVIPFSQQDIHIINKNTEPED